MEGMNIWKTMSQIDTRKLVEKKNGFTYLSWSHALRLLKDHVPDAMVTKHIFKQPDGTFLPYMVDPAGFAYVQVTVTLGKDVAAATEIMPVLNHANRPVQKPNSFEVNGPDNSGVKANEGTASTIYSYHDDKTATGAVPSGNLKQLSLAEEIAMCPDIEALKTLYNRVQLRLTAEDRQLFTSRKKEFING
jgi:hypothetical protein